MSQRVLHVTKWYPHRQDPQNGVFVQKHIAATQGPYHILGLLNFQGPPEKTEHGTLFGAIGMSLAAKWGAFYAALSKFQPDVVHFHCFANDLAPLALSCKARNLPYLCSEHWSGYLPERPYNLSLKHRLLARWMWHGAARVLPVSPVLEQGIRALAPKARLSVVPNIVEAVAKPSTLAPTASFSFVVVADIVFAIKRQDLILEAFRSLPRARAELHFIGGGPDLEQLQRLVKRDVNVFVHGRMENETVLKELHRFNALVSFSAYETFGIAPFEARAAGLQVLTLNHFGGTYFLDEHAQRVANDLESLKKALADALDRPTPPAAQFEQLSARNIGALLDQHHGDF